jgi:hypothetical protein
MSYLKLIDIGLSPRIICFSPGLLQVRFVVYEVAVKTYAPRIINLDFMWKQVVRFRTRYLSDEGGELD